MPSGQALASACILVASLAGCLGGPDGSGGPPPAPPTPGPGVPSPPKTPELVAPSPDWLVGEWWSWRIDNELYGSTTVTTVVTGASANEYRVGVTDLAEGLVAVFFHAPPLGVLPRPSLAWEAHDRPEQVLAFPMTDGKTWTGETHSGPLTFTARLIEATGVAGPEPAFQVTGVDDAGNVRLDYTWSVLAGTFLMYVTYGFDGEPFTAANLLDHGYGHTSGAFVLSSDELFIGGVGAPDPASPPGVPPAPPSATFDVPEGLSAMVVGCFLGGAEGLYSATLTPPTGGGEPVACQAQNGPGASGFTLQLRSATAAPGTWGVAMAPVGRGGVFVEALGVSATEETPGTTPHGVT